MNTIQQQEIKEALSKCHDLLRDIDIYGDFSRPKQSIQECSMIATNGLNELYEKYPKLFLPGIKTPVIIVKQIRKKAINQIRKDYFNAGLSKEEVDKMMPDELNKL